MVWLDLETRRKKLVARQTRPLGPTDRCGADRKKTRNQLLEYYFEILCTYVQSSSKYSSIEFIELSSALNVWNAFERTTRRTKLYSSWWYVEHKTLSSKKHFICEKRRAKDAPKYENMNIGPKLSRLGGLGIEADMVFIATSSTRRRGS